MKTRFRKILSILLTVAMLLSCAIVTGVQAAENEEEIAYYVQYGGTGNGTEPTSPVATVADAVKLINEKYGAGDTVNVYIMQSEQRDLNKGKKEDGTDYTIGYEKELVHGYTTWATRGSIDAHKAKLIIKPYTTDSATYLVFGSYIADTGSNLHFNGPTEIYNISLLSNRKTYNTVRFNSNSVVFGAGTTVGTLGYSATTGVGDITRSAAITVFLGKYSGGSTYTDDIDVVFKNNIAYSTGNTVTLGNFTGSDKYTGNYTLTYDYSNTSVVAPLLLCDGKTANVSETYNNLNVYIKSPNTLKIRYTKDTKKVTVNGGLQFIYVDGAAVLDSTGAVFAASFCPNMTVNGGEWYIKNSTGDKDAISYTSVAGTYKVAIPENHTLTATDVSGEKEDVVLNSDATELVLEPGTWNITYEDNTPVCYEYFVRSLGYKEMQSQYDAGGDYSSANDGKSPQNPAATVEDVIKNINAEGKVKAGEEVTINIMQRSDWNNAGGQSVGGSEDLVPYHNITSWSHSDNNTANYQYYVPDYNYKLKIQAYRESEEDTSEVYLAFTDRLGSNSRMYLGGSTVFSDITLLGMRNTESIFSANGHSCTFEETAAIKVLPTNYSTGLKDYNELEPKSAAIKFFKIYRDATNAQADKIDININSPFSTGAFTLISHKSASATIGALNIAVNNSAAGLPIVWGTGVASKTANITNLNIDIKNASSASNAKGTGSVKVTNLQVIYPVNDAISFNLDDISTLTATNKWLIANGTDNADAINYVKDEDGNIVQGKYSVTVPDGERYILYKNGVLDTDNIISKSVELELGAGEYKLVELGTYINTGTKINAFEECEIDLTKESHADKDGELFIGWKKGDDFCTETTVTLGADESLVAEYIAFAADSFVMEEAELRTEDSLGIRYILKLTKAEIAEISNFVGFEYGSIYVNTDSAGGREIRLDEKIVTSWKWDSAASELNDVKVNGTLNLTPTKVLGTNILQEDEEHLRYTLCLTGDKLNENYNTFYTARGYIKFNDKNGIVTVIYTDDLTTSAYKLASEETEKTDTHNEIIAAVEKENEEYVASLEYTPVTTYTKDVSAENYYRARNTDTSDEFGRLKDSLGISYVKRTVTIDTGKNIEETKIGWLSDIHFGSISQTDVDRKDPVALTIYRYRKWATGSGLLDSGVRTVNYIRKTYATSVITGDMVDYYFAHGPLLSVKNLITSKSINNSILMTTGNHEFSASGVDKANAILTALGGGDTTEKKYEKLQTIWTNDVKYGEKIVSTNGKDAVMLVTLENAVAGKPYEYCAGTSDKLADSIERANEKGIPILIFQHIPIVTKNPNETNLCYFDNDGDNLRFPDENENNSTSVNMMTTTSWCCEGRGANGENTKTIELIRKNSDVIKGIFSGHTHANFYSELQAWDGDGKVIEGEYIPQFTTTTSAYNNWVNEIVIK